MTEGPRKAGDCARRRPGPSKAATGKSLSAQQLRLTRVARPAGHAACSGRLPGGSMKSNPHALDAATWARSRLADGRRRSARRRVVAGLPVGGTCVVAVPRGSKTRWRSTSPSSCSSSCRSCSSSCSGWCTCCRKRSRTSGTIRSSRPSARCACCRSSSAGCSGRWPGCGRTPSRSATSWPTAPTSIPTTSRSTASRSRRAPPPTSGSAWPRSKGAACQPVSSTPFAPTWQRSRRGWPRASARSEVG